MYYTAYVHTCICIMKYSLYNTIMYSTAAEYDTAGVSSGPTLDSPVEELSARHEVGVVLDAICAAIEDVM